MREIKYRGLSKLTNKLIYGFYYNMDAHKDDNSLRHMIVYRNKGPGTQTIHEPIEEKTVGQFSGIKDFNKKEIYEDDIVKIKFMDIFEDKEFIGIVKFYDGSFFIENEKLKKTHFLFREIDVLEVIGNKFDSPELLKEIVQK